MKDDNLHFILDMEECVKCPDHQYADIHHKHCLQKSVTFLAYEDSLGKALAGTALSFTILTIVVLGLFVKHCSSPIVKANNRNLSYILLLSLSFCFLCSLLFIGHPKPATCILQHVTFGIVFTVAVSTILAKTNSVVLAFKITAPGKKIKAVAGISGTNLHHPNLLPDSTHSLQSEWGQIHPTVIQVHTLNVATSSSCAIRAPSLPSAVSWHTWTPWP